MEGVTVTAVGQEVSAVTDVNGEFTMDVEPGVEFFTTAATGYWGIGRCGEIDELGVSDLALDVASDDLVAAIGRLAGISYDEMKGTVSVRFSNVSGVGGDTVSLSVTASSVVAFGEVLAGEPATCNGLVPTYD